MLAHDPLSIPLIRKLLHENSAGNRPAGAPLLVVQGSADTTVPQALTDMWTTKACAIGDTVDYTIYPGATHSTVIAAAQERRPVVARRPRRRHAGPVHLQLNGSRHGQVEGPHSICLRADPRRTQWEQTATSSVA